MHTRPRLLAGLAGAAVASLAASSLVAAPATTSASAGSPHRTPRPNIVFVLADDLGWSDVSTGRTNLGNPNDFNETPTIERLAQEGAVFDNAYACINCAPTRAALLTGQYAPRPTNNIYAVGDLNRGGDDTLLEGPPEGLPDGRVALPDEAVTVAETLQTAGYATGYVGKFHVTRSADDITAVHGFDENLGGSQAGNATAYHAADGQFNNSVSPSLDQFAADYTVDYVQENIAPYSHGVSADQLDALVGADKHVSDAVGDAAIDFVDRHAEQPFFAFVSEFAVHSPVGNPQARRDLLKKYQAKIPGSSPVKPSYAALTEGLDQTLARLVDHLETTPDPRNPGHALADNTLVVFSSDNGGRSDLGAFNGPLKGQKGELDEGGVRVPWIVWSKNRDLVDRGALVHTPINGTDLYPTVASWARARLPRHTVFDGKDLGRAIATGSDRRPQERFAHLPGYLVEAGRDQRPQSSVRDGRWKLVYSYEDATWELYDLVSDLGEQHNLAAERPAVVADLGRQLIRWLDRTNAPLATLRAGKEPLVLAVDGATYADGRVDWRRRGQVTIAPGDEVPLVLQRRS
jgi:arylsulfatase A-like enzyme